MAEATLDGLEQATNLDVARRYLDLDKLVVLLHGAVCLAVRELVEEGCNILGETVADLAELVVVTVDLVWVAAVSTFLCMCLEVVSGP